MLLEVRDFCLNAFIGNHFTVKENQLSSVGYHFAAEIPKLHELVTFVFQRFHT